MACLVSARNVDQRLDRQRQYRRKKMLSLTRLSQGGAMRDILLLDDNPLYGLGLRALQQLETQRESSGELLRMCVNFNDALVIASFARRRMSIPMYGMLLALPALPAGPFL